MAIPYIGITDFTNFGQVDRMIGVFNSHKRPGGARRLHVGVMMSHKTLYGLETRFTKIFPVKETIAKIFSSDEVMNCLHYADYDHHSGIISDLTKAIWSGGIGINALQLDMTWPQPGDIAQATHASRKKLEVILQVGKKAIELCNNDPKEVVERLRDYEGVIHYVLLDKSMGHGHSMDAHGLIPFACAIRENFPELGLAVAGGLGPDSMELVQPLLDAFPDISFDAEGKLRPSGSIMDPVDWDMAAAYLIRALELVS